MSQSLMHFSNCKDRPLGLCRGGNPDPTSTSGKNADKAKAMELQGWDYQKHLAGRAYGLIVHGDVAGIEGARRSLSDWLDWMGLLIPAPNRSSIDLLATTSRMQRAMRRLMKT
jgi:hypothetical protein